MYMTYHILWCLRKPCQIVFPSCIFSHLNNKDTPKHSPISRTRSIFTRCILTVQCPYCHPSCDRTMATTFGRVTHFWTNFKWVHEPLGRDFVSTCTQALSISQDGTIGQAHFGHDLLTKVRGHKAMVSILEMDVIPPIIESPQSGTSETLQRGTGYKFHYLINTNQSFLLW